MRQKVSYSCFFVRLVAHPIDHRQRAIARGKGTWAIVEVTGAYKWVMTLQGCGEQGNLPSCPIRLAQDASAAAACDVEAKVVPGEARLIDFLFTVSYYRSSLTREMGEDTQVSKMKVLGFVNQDVVHPPAVW